MSAESGKLLNKLKIPENQIPVNEIFTSVQGEGFHHGKAAFFIRFAGCDIGCIWCDSKDAWSMEESDLMFIDDIVAQSIESKLDLVVITGGEPLIYDLSKLTNALVNQGKKIHIETSGAYPIFSKFDWLSLSPKKVHLPHQDVYHKANELKIAVNDSTDLAFAQQESEKVNADCHLFLQPQWKQLKQSLPSILEFIKINPSWRLSLQNHKFLGIK